MRTIHSVKSRPEYFKAAIDGTKTFEIRRNDRNYKVGDLLQQLEYFEESESFSGRSRVFEITYITNFMQRDDYVVMSIKPCGLVVEIP